jgi:ABC-type phosphate/phosphonate transport system ATPase subunit
MSSGRIVFDGAPHMLTEAILRDIYGQAADEPLDERLTSTTPPEAPLAAVAN